MICPKCGFRSEKRKPAKNLKAKAVRERHIAKGLCIQGCGNKISPLSKSRCEECLEVERIKRKAKYDALKAQSA